jgi:phage terminase small subunit
MNRLTDKEQAFVDHYIITLNGTQSAINAGYSENSARQIASENLSKPHIRAAIDKKLRKLTMTADETMKRLSDMASGDLTRYITIQGELDLEAIKEDNKGHLLKKYKHVKRTIRHKNGDETEIEHNEFEFYPADSAIDKLMRYYSLYNDKVTLDWKEEVIQLVNDGRITREQVEKELGNELATELFASANLRTD